MSEKLTQRERKARIRKGLPIEALGLQFYPIKMADYEEFLECKNALAIRLTSLSKVNIEYLSMPFLAALWAMDLDSVNATGKAIGMFERVIRLLYLSLRLGYDSQKAFGKIYCERENPRQLTHIEVEQTDGEPVKISPVDFTTIIRPLIAELNGIELPDESSNTDLLETEREMSNAEQSKLKFDLDNLISSVAYLSHTDERTVDEWTVLQFERRNKAIQRDKQFTLYGQAEMSGMVSFKNGNPYPSWCFDRTDNLSPALLNLDEMQDKYKGIGDVKATVAQGSQT